MKTKLIDIIRQRIHSTGPIRYDEFIDLVLYHPQYGYYTQKKERIGKKQNTDFFTATSLNPTFPNLVEAACQSLCQTYGLDESQHHFIEVGAEPQFPLFEIAPASFASYRGIGNKDSTEIPAQPCILFSNELFDAQAFRRFVYQKGIWKEKIITLSTEGELKEDYCPPINAPELPNPASTSPYHLDYPTGAKNILEKLLSFKWNGLFLAFDYGLSRQELLAERPQGTARVYQNHKCTDKLLENIGEADITCHICWDDLADCLSENGFTQIEYLNQERFFMKYAQSRITEIIESAKDPTDSALGQLRELLHPHHMGSRFQAISAVRY